MKKKNIICILLVLTLLLTPLWAFNAFSSGSSQGDLQWEWEYEQDFSDIDSVRDHFAGFYQYDFGGAKTDNPIAESLSEAKLNNSRLYIEDKKLKRNTEIENDIQNSMGTKSFAIATFKKKKYVNFVAEIKFKAGNMTDLWPVIAFRQTDMGRYFLEDGIGVFMQSGGQVTVWGSLGVGGPYQTAVVPNYDKFRIHTMRIIVIGQKLSVYLDGSIDPVYEHILPRSSFILGYVSLMSINNDCEFSSFKIAPLPVTKLPEPEKQQPLPDAGTEDSLENLAEKEVDYNWQFNELDGLTQDKKRP